MDDSRYRWLARPSPLLQMDAAAGRRHLTSLSVTNTRDLCEIDANGGGGGHELMQKLFEIEVIELCYVNYLKGIWPFIYVNQAPPTESAQS